MTTRGESWPEPEPENTDQETALYQAKLDAQLKRLESQAAHEAASTATRTALDAKQFDDDLARAAAERAAELVSKAAYEQSLIDVAKGTLDRARANADLVQKASSAIIAIYTGALALAFSVAEHPLPLRGLIPAILLGLAVVASTVYLAYATDPRDVEGPRPTSALREMARRRVAAFIIWTRAAAFTRIYWLRVSVLALAASLAFLPAPFLSSSNRATAAAIKPATGWPKAPKRTDEFAKILFQAKVNEAAGLRTDEVARAERASPVGSGGETWWWAGFGVALAAIFIVPLLRKPNQTAPTTADAEEAV